MLHVSCDRGGKTRCPFTRSQSAGSAHFARAISAEKTVYLLHSRECKRTNSDLRECRFSVALDTGITAMWDHAQDVPVLAGIWEDRLIPVRIISGTERGAQRIARTRIRLVDPDNRDDAGASYEQVGFEDTIIEYLNGPLRRDTMPDSHRYVDAAIESLRVGDRHAAARHARNVGVYLTEEALP